MNVPKFLFIGILILIDPTINPTPAPISPNEIPPMAAFSPAETGLQNQEFEGQGGSSPAAIPISLPTINPDMDPNNIPLS